MVRTMLSQSLAGMERQQIEQSTTFGLAAIRLESSDEGSHCQLVVDSALWIDGSKIENEMCQYRRNAPSNSGASYTQRPDLDVYRGIRSFCGCIRVQRTLCIRGR